MGHELTIAIIAGLGGMLGWGLADFFAKKTIDAIGDVTSLLWGHVFGTLTLIGFVIYRIGDGGQLVLPTRGATWGFLIFFGVLQAIIYLLVYRGFGKGQVAVLAPVFASFSGLTAILSILVFGEIITGHFISVILAIFLGIILLNIDVGALRSRQFAFAKVPGFKEVGIATLLAAFWTLFWDKLVGGEDWLSYTLYMYLVMTIAIFAWTRIRRIPLSVGNKNLWKFLVLIGVCEIVAYLAVSLGYSATTLTSIVALLSGAFSLPTILLARIFLKERVTRIQTVGSVVIIAGIMLLALL